MRTARLAFLLALVLPAAARAATYEIRPSDDLYARLRTLAAGDEVIVHEGTYPTPGFLEVTWAGRADAPIVIRGADGEARPVLMGDPSQNVINVTGSYFTMRHLEITGGSHGIRLASADHATFEDLVIHDVADVGLSCNRAGETCDSLTIRHNEIHHTGTGGGPGEGMYLGCNDAACVFSNSIIEDNYIHDTDGGEQGDGIEVKTGSFGNVLRDNVIIRTRYPGITLYGFDPATGAPNVVERNLVWHTVDNGIQIVGQAIVRNNIVVDAGVYGIHSKASQGFSPNDAIIVNNTVVSSAMACLKINDWGATTGGVVANNALYCEGGISVEAVGGTPGASLLSNVVRGETRGVTAGFSDGIGLVEDLGAEHMLARVYPPATSALLDVASAAEAPPDDFDGTLRSDSMPDVGAYERSGLGVGWVVVEGFKQRRGTPVPDGGMPMADGGPSGGEDGGAPGADSGTPPADGGMTAGSGGEDDGCGCVAPGATEGRSAAPLLLLVGLLAFQRRRRRVTSPRASASPRASTLRAVSSSAAGVVTEQPPLRR